MSTDAIVILKDEHRVMRKLFRDFHAASDGAHATKGRIVRKIVELLTVHTYIENEVMYPRVCELLPELDKDVLESYEEHHVADVLCLELATMSPDDRHFDAKATVLIENVEHHMHEEEDAWFPKVRAGLTRTTLQDIGAELLLARESAPRHPAQPSALRKAIDAIRA